MSTSHDTTRIEEVDDDTFTQSDILSMLSPETLSALNQHIDEKKKQDSVIKNALKASKKPKDNKEQSTNNSNNTTGNTNANNNDRNNDENNEEVDIKSTVISENFGMSQFWYTNETSNTLALEALSLGGELPDDDYTSIRRIACISCPSIFQALLKLSDTYPKAQFYVLEYDQRFAIYKNQFIYYDYNEPLAVPSEYHHTFDFVICDPPYLSDECMNKTGSTMNLLKKNKNTKCIFNTGATLAKSIGLVLEMKPVVFRPQHSRMLLNEFRSFTNYNSKRLGGYDKSK